MNTDFYPGDSSLDGWLTAFSYSTVQQLLQPETLIWIVAVVFGVAVLAFAVASMTASQLPSPSTAEHWSALPRSSMMDASPEPNLDGSARAGEACPWACPWRAGLRLVLKTRLEARPTPAH